MKDLIKNLKKLFTQKPLLTEEQISQINEETIIEAEKVLENLKDEEKQIRDKVANNLKDIFDNLPILL